MKLDMDLVREILLALEAPQFDGSLYAIRQPEDLNLPGRTQTELRYHIERLAEAGLVDGQAAGQSVMVRALTWQGHQFVATVRDPEIWKRTKEGAEKVGGFGLELFASLAKGLIKKQIEKYTGVEIEL